MKQTKESYQNADEVHKMSTLFNRATCSSSNREKNQLLTQLRSIAIEYLSKYDKAIAHNSIREKELVGLQKNYEDILKNLKITKSHVDQKNELQKRGVNSESKVIVARIKSLEDELKTYAPIERPSLLQDALDKHVDKSLEPILLWDIEMQRYEELIYMLQKRIISVEQNQECSEHILEEFGSVFGLIDEYKSLSKENQRIKKEEAQYLSDPIVRRRINANVSPLATRSLITVLQKELKSQIAILNGLKIQKQNDLVKCNSASEVSVSSTKKLNKTRSSVYSIEKKEDPIDKIIETRPDFDVMCKDPLFTMSSAVYNMPSGRVETNKLEELPMGEALNEIKRNVVTADDQLKKIEADLVGMRKFVFPQDPTAGTRLNKLIELNQRLMAQIQGIHQKIDQTNDSISNLFSQLKKVSVSKLEYQSTTSSIFEPFRNLLHDYYDLSDHYTHDLSIDKSLACISSLFAVDVVNQKPLEQLLFNYIQPQIDEDEACRRVQLEREREKERTKTVESKRLSKPLKTINRLGSMQKLKKITNPDLMLSPTIGVSPAQTPTIEESPRSIQSSPNRIKNSSTTTLSDGSSIQSPSKIQSQPLVLSYCLLTRLAECSSFIFNKQNNSHKNFMDSWEKIEAFLTKGLKAKLTAFEVEQRDSFSQVSFCGNGILVKEKKTIETMTLPEERGEMETQYEDQKKKPTKPSTKKK